MTQEPVTVGEKSPPRAASRADKGWMTSLSSTLNFTEISKGVYIESPSIILGRIDFTLSMTGFYYVPSSSFEERLI